jgi:hypothetical protein
MHVDLGSRKTDARRSVHSVEHIIHQGFYTIIYRCYRISDLAKTWVRELKDWK